MRKIGFTILSHVVLMLLGNLPAQEQTKISPPGPTQTVQHHDLTIDVYFLENTYRPGDAVQLTIETSKTAYFKIYQSNGVSGKLKKIFPIGEMETIGVDKLEFTDPVNGRMLRSGNKIGITKLIILIATQPIQDELERMDDRETKYRGAVNQPKSAKPYELVLAYEVIEEK